MAKRDLSTGEIISETELALEFREIFERYPLTKALLPKIEEVLKLLLYIDRDTRPTLSEAQRASIMELIASEDVQWDTVVRAAIELLRCFAVVFPVKKVEFETCLQKLFREGGRIVQSTVENEIGESSYMKALIERDEQVRRTLEQNSVNGLSLLSFVQRITDSAERLKPYVEQLRVPVSSQEDVIMEFKARNQWISLWTTAERLADLAGWTPEEKQKVFGRIDELSARRTAARSPAPVEELPAVP